jgi:hypothetical protein
MWTDRNFSWLRDGPRVRAVLRDSVAFAKSWLDVTGDSTDLPSVDFSQFNVVLVAGPSKPTGQYYIHIDSIYRREPNATIYVVVTEIAPGSRCVVSDDGSRPVKITLIPASSDSVQFVEQRSQTSCPN